MRTMKMKTSECEQVQEQRSASLPADRVAGGVTESDSGRTAHFLVEGPHAVPIIAIIAISIVAIVAMLVVH